MKAFKIFIGIILAASFASCEGGKSRADIEKDFEGVEDLGPDYQMTTIDKRTASSEDPHAFNGSTDDLDKKKQEEQKQQEIAKNQAANNTNTTSEKKADEGVEEVTPVANGGSEATATETTAQPTPAPAKTTAEPAKTTPEPARQQVVVNKSEPKKQDVVVDGQAQ